VNAGTSESLHVLVLAAGASVRLGQPKQLVHVAGRPALHSVVSQATAIAGHAVTVVLGAHASDLTHLLQHSGASLVVNRNWQEGMASSIRFGVAALPPACDAVLIHLGDQVAVTSDDLRRLVSAWRGEDSIIAAATYRGTVGVPAIFPRWCFSELMQLRGDHGAKSIIDRYRSRLAHVAMPNAALDLDTAEDLAHLQQKFGPQAANDDK
jgi:molybdenum cofactor cytidylyltransferase